MKAKEAVKLINAEPDIEAKYRRFVICVMGENTRILQMREKQGATSIQSMRAVRRELGQWARSVILRSEFDWLKESAGETIFDSLIERSDGLSAFDKAQVLLEVRS